MIDESKQDLLVQYLLNEVDAPTAEKIRTELETDAELREFVRETEDAFASMALAAPPMEPPAGLSQRILQSERNVLPVFCGRIPASEPAEDSLVGLSVGLGGLSCHRVRHSAAGGELACTKKTSRFARNSWRPRKKMPRSRNSWLSCRRKIVFAEIQIATLKAQVANYGTASAVVVWDKEHKNGVLQVEKLPPARNR